MYIAYKDDSKIASAKATVSKIATLSNFVYSQGKPARVVTRIYMPEGIEAVELENKTVNFRLRTKSGIIDVSENTVSNLAGNLPTSPGFYNIAIIAEEDFVNITVV
jgi:hypothetical protein